MEDREGFVYAHPRPAVTVDVVLVRESVSEILLIRRKSPPFEGAWALPGGFVGHMEPLERAAERELKEETGVSGTRLEQIGAWGDPGRDPRGHTISVVYRGYAGDEVEVIAGDDAAEARWFPLAELPDLAFDHESIIEAAVPSASGFLSPPDRRQ